ncbi:ADOP family duplicated permease [Planctomycetota bacterium]
MTTTINDIKHSLRQLAKTPGFTVIAIITLAVGIGVNAAVFSLINGWMLRPLPGARDGDLVRLFCRSTESKAKYRAFSYAYYQALQQQNSPFTSLAAFISSAHLLRNEGISHTIAGAYVSSNFFDTLGVSPAHGRGFNAEEEQPGQHTPVVILSHRFWQSLGGDSQIIGQTVSVDDIPVTVIGIMAASFVSASQATNQQIWLPLGMKGGFPGSRGIETTPRLLSHDYRPLLLIGELKPGLRRDAVSSQLEPMASNLATAYPETYANLRLSVGTVGNFMMAPWPGHGISVGKPLTALIIVSTCILSIACINLGQLFLARGLSRQRDIAIRLSLGCSHARMMSQLMTEGLLLALAGTAVGLPIALWSLAVPVRAFEQWTGGEGTIPVELDWRLVLAGLGLCLLTTLLFCLAPTWRLTGSGQVSHLRESTGTASRQHTWLRKTLIAAQVTLAFALVSCAGLFVQSAQAAAASDPGFSLDRGLLIHLALRQKGRETMPRILSELRAMPDIENVSLSTNVPFCEAHHPGSFHRLDQTESSDLSSVHTYINTIGADYFKSLDLPILRGREFTLEEERSSEGTRVALIDRLLADRLWPNKNPIGQFLQHSDKPQERLRIVGVVPHLKTTMLENPPVPWVYRSYGQNYDHVVFAHVQLRAPLSPAALTQMKQSIQEALLALDPNMRLRGIRSWQEHIETFSFQSLTIKLGAQLFATLGILALCLAALGLYGVKSYWLSQRTREIGIRMALGATRSKVIGLVLHEGILLTCLGLGVGLLLTWAGSRFLESLLFEASAANPWVLLTATAVLCATILLASLLPARRAAKLNPMEALRCE